MTVQTWKPTKSPDKLGIAIYNFHATHILYGLSLKVGETVQISEECSEWFRGWLTNDVNKKGIFPKNCIVIRESVLVNPGPYEIVRPVTEPIVEEVTLVLREWQNFLKETYLERNKTLFSMLKKVMIELIENRKEIVRGKLIKEQQTEIKEKMTSTIDVVNSKLSLDLVPRVEGELVDSDYTSVIELYIIHMKSQSKTNRERNTSNTRPPPTSKFATMTKRMSMAPSSQQNAPQHVFISFKTFMCNIGEEATLVFGLYDAYSSTFISESYIVKLTKHGMPVNIDMLGRQNAVFSDLKPGDVYKDIYLVCKIYRYGRLVADSKKSGTAIYKRPFGAGAFPISDILCGEIEEEKEIYIEIFNCNEYDFYILEDFIVKKQTNKYSAIGSNSSNVCVSLKKYYGSLEKVTKEKGNFALTPSLGLPEVILPGYVRNDFFVTLVKADLDKGSKSTGRNIEVSMCVVSEKGQVFNDCMSVGSGTERVTEYRSVVLYHTNSPNWKEMVKISLPNEQFHTAHLRFTFSHCSRNEGKVKGERMFGFSFIRLLQDDNTVIPDGAYGMYVYKFDNSISFTQAKTYLRLASTPVELIKQEKSGVMFAGPQRNVKDCLTVNTYLCSTKLTQNSDIQHLLRWRRMSDEDIQQALSSLLKVSPDEIVKFLQDIFDALFKILSEKAAEFSLPVFKVLVSITKLVEEEKFEQFKSTLSTYVECHFSAALAYRSLVSNLMQVLEHHHNDKTTFKNSIMSLHYLFKMIIRSYQLHNTNSKTPEVISDFKNLLMKTFESIIQLMASTNDHINESKLEVVRNIPDMCDDILLVFKESEFSICVEKIISRLPKISNNLQARKLKYLQKIVSSRLFRHRDGRFHLLPAVLKHLGYLLDEKIELSSCLELLGDIITSLHHLPQEEIFNDVSMLVTSVLNTLLKVFLTIDRKSQHTGLTVSCLFGILRLMNEKHFETYVREFQNQNDLRDFLKKVTYTFNELLSLDVFPKDWYIIKMVGNSVMLTTIQYLSKAFVEHFLEGDLFHKDLWKSYLELGVDFLKQPSLFLESFSGSKREKVLQRYGDMRQAMASEIMEMWDALGENKKEFIPQLIGPFLEMSLVPENELRRTTIPVFFDMMLVEYNETTDIVMTESELIDKLELFMGHSMGDIEFEQLFSEILTERLEACGNADFRTKGLKSIKSITELLKRLLDYRAVNHEDSNAYQKKVCTVRLFEFYKELNRDDMYVRHIHKLVRLHEASQHYTEAAYTLLLHATKLGWSERLLPAFLNYPKQTEFERKEQIYLEIVEYFNKGKTWEAGIRLCKELAVQYENQLVDYTKLSEILRRQALFYDSIMKEIRPPPTYFRVSFYGRGFPHYLKDKVLICRGLELETLAGFTTRMNAEFPNAEIMFKNTPPDASVIEGIGQHIQICNVNPVPGEIQMTERKDINEKVSGYYRSNDVGEFVYSRPFHRGEKDKDNEFKTLWMERTVHWTERRFPGILRWSNVESIRKTELTPLENAIELISSKNEQLTTTIDMYRANSTNVNPLSMILNGVIDANVNGGIANYQNAFLTDEYLAANPQDREPVENLGYLLDEQSKILEEGLEVHETFVCDSLKPFHDKMLMMYSAMKISIETGQPMEKILSRPTSSVLNSSTRSTPNKPSPPSSLRSKLPKTPSSLSDYKREHKTSKLNLSASFQNILRKQSLPEQPSPTGDKEPRKSLQHPPSTLPIRRMHSPADEKEALPIEFSLAASKRMVPSPLANSAPSLGHIAEETPSLPPKRSSLRLSNNSLKSLASNHRKSLLLQDTNSETTSIASSVEDPSQLSVDDSNQFSAEDSNQSSLEDRNHLSVPSSDEGIYVSPPHQRPDELSLSDSINEHFQLNFTQDLIYNNVGSTPVEDKRFYDSPKELAPYVYNNEAPPPLPDTHPHLPATPKRKSDAQLLDDVHNGTPTAERPPMPPARKTKPRPTSITAVVNNTSDDENDSPPPLPRKQSMKSASENGVTFI